MPKGREIGVTGPRKRLAIAAALAAAAVSLFGGVASPAQAAGTPCPTFQVLHNDRIGPAVLPKGIYNIKLVNPGLSCAGASHNFTIFLQDYDGKLGGGWKVVAQGTGKAAFKYKGTIYFRVARVGGAAAGAVGAAAAPATRAPAASRSCTTTASGRSPSPRATTS